MDIRTSLQTYSRWRITYPMFLRGFRDKPYPSRAQQAGVPAFDKEAFERHISSAVRTYQEQARKIILSGHSTGGILALPTGSEGLITPGLLILTNDSINR